MKKTYIHAELNEKYELKIDSEGSIGSAITITGELVTTLAKELDAEDIESFKKILNSAVERGVSA